MGFMTINRYVDLDLLNSQFELSVFNGLRKPDERDKIPRELEEYEKERDLYLADKVDPDLNM